MDLPKYESDSDNESDLDIVSNVSSTFLSRENTVKTDYDDDDDDDDDYESDTNDTGIPPRESLFEPLINTNVFPVNGNNTFYIGLKEKQTLYIAGVFDLQIVKGGIIYNNNHYNASNKQILNMWHPLSSSVPAIGSSYFAGWNEPIFNKSILSTIPLLNPIDFVCIIKLSNCKKNYGITQSHRLLSDLNFFWQPRSIRLNNHNESFLQSFTILSMKNDIFTPLQIPSQWIHFLENLHLEITNSEFDTRIMIIGGKNSGKSTLLRLLTERIVSYEDQQNNNSAHINEDEQLWYLDLDPGQPEYSPPECLSLGSIQKFNNQQSNIRSLGATFGQCGVTPLRRHFLGVSSPQENPELYLTLIDDLIDYLDDQYFTGTSLLNLPGWIKGFGINIINHVIMKYKPTHIVMLETGNKINLEEIYIPTNFSNNLQPNYSPNIIRLSPHRHTNTDKNDDIYNQLKFQASQLRVFRMLLWFHKTFSDNNNGYQFDFNPLLTKTPLQISIGAKNSINGIYFMEEFQNLHKDDIKGTLEGCIVGIHKYTETSNNTNGPSKPLRDITKLVGKYPLIKGKRDPNHFEYVTLGLIHSIDENKNLINIYVPETDIETLTKNNCNWILVRGKTETPMCELYPPKKTISEHINMNEVNTPYISTERAKKQEHVWKIRKNIQRRGHFMK